MEKKNPRTRTFIRCSFVASRVPMQRLFIPAITAQDGTGLAAGSENKTGEFPLTLEKEEPSLKPLRGPGSWRGRRGCRQAGVGGRACSMLLGLALFWGFPLSFTSRSMHF